MINLKKIVAVTLAATMCMGVSMVAFAADPVEATQGPPVVEPAATSSSGLEGVASPFYVDEVGVKLSNGKGEKNTEIDTAGILGETDTWESINTRQEVLDILKENKMVDLPDNTNIIPLYAKEITGISKDMDNVITFTLSSDDFSKRVSDIEKYHPGDTIWAMVETGNNTGVWEMVPGVLNGDGQVDFKIDHTGGFILLKTMKNGVIVKMEKDAAGNDITPPVIVNPDPENPGTSVVPSDSQGTSNGAAASSSVSSSGTSTTSSLGTSPKTGEF